MGSDDRNQSPWQGPLILVPEWQSRGPTPATQMLGRDLLLQPKFSHGQCLVGPHYQPPEAATIPVLPQPALSETDIQELQDYLQSIDANIMVPPRQPPAQEDEDPGASAPVQGPPAPPTEEGWKLGMTGASTGSKDGGVSVEDRRGVREYLASGYTRTNPDGFRNPDGTWNTIKTDNDFGGKWDETVRIAGGEAKREFFDVAAAEGSFGTPTSTIQGSGSAFSSSSGAAAQFSITQEGANGVSPGLRADAGADVQGAVLKGQVGSGSELAEETQTLATGQASGSALSGKAEGKVELVATAEQVTLGGKLGAEINLLEGKIEGDLHITPRRVVNNGVNLYNWAFGTNHGELLGENWDIGITVGGEVSGQIGAQAGAEARAGYENGKARAEAGAKIGLGVGAGVKGRVGVVGVDKVWNGMKWAGGKVADGAGAAWDWAWGD